MLTANSYHAVIAAPEHHAGIVALMQSASAGCFCRFWHFAGDDNAWQARCNLEPEANREALESALARSDDEARGLVALADGAVIGWLKLCPLSRMAKLGTRRLYRSMPRFRETRAGVYLAACLLVRPDARRHGVARALVRASVDAVRAWGGRAVEAVPRAASAQLRDDELWTGPASAFLEAGFVKVDGPDAYPVLRFDLDREKETCNMEPEPRM